VTIVLVTHFMEEAERLADRVALIDSGRVVAVDTPAGLTEAAAPEQVIRFSPSVPLPEGLLEGVSGVRAIKSDLDEVVVTGTGEVLGAVVSVLARNGIVANRLRVEQPSLEDAFVALTNDREGRN
jgi:ABC-2 type transport system ATP-binding protein